MKAVMDFLNYLEAFNEISVAVRLVLAAGY